MTFPPIVHLFVAHAFGQTYNLPIPIWLFLFGGAAAVITSFIIASLFVQTTSDNNLTINRPLFKIPRSVVIVGQFISLAVYLLIILAGFIGVQSSSLNISPTLFWVLIFITTAHVTILVGDIYRVVNPFKLLFRGIERILRGDYEPPYTYPLFLGYAPALVLFLVIIFAELFSNGWAVVPRNLSWLAILYGTTMIVGALAFGKDIWFKYGDFFGVFFAMFAKLSAFIFDNRRVYYRKPLSGCLQNTTQSTSLLVFIIFMLASTAYDGLRETAVYYSLYNPLSSLFSYSSIAGQIIDVCLLLLLLGLFLAAYLVTIVIIKRMTLSKDGVFNIANSFAPSLIPIAVAYNVAHYFTLELIQGQQLIRLISDPFGVGWNLFNTIGYTINPSIVNASTVWYVQLGLIIIGHIAAVYIAHVIALKLYKNPQTARRSQYPMLTLMVLFTMTSLWIIAQAIVAK